MAGGIVVENAGNLQRDRSRIDALLAEELSQLRVGVLRAQRRERLVEELHIILARGCPCFIEPRLDCGGILVRGEQWDQNDRACEKIVLVRLGP